MEKIERAVETEGSAAPAKRMPAWPLVVIAAAAFVAVWSGWVGLGRMTGFGEVALLPGIADQWVINSAITLPLGMEAYAAYALRAWLVPPAGLSRFARRYAAFSALGALMLGAAGQVAFHLMKAAGLTVAPWEITTFVSVLPVVVLGAAAALFHLIRNSRDDEGQAEEQPPAPEARQELEELKTAAPIDGTPTTPLPRVEAAAELPAGEDMTGTPAVLALATEQELQEQRELDDCDTKKQKLLVAWKHLGVQGVPETSDIPPAVEWLADHGVRVDISGAYAVRRDLERKERKAAARRPALTVAGAK
jgi:hypothetical protein